MIDVTCLRTDLTRAERKELFEREKREYDALIAQGKQIPYQDFSSWKLEEFKSERSCGWRDFLHADDGWITIPEVSNVRMDSYKIEIVPAGGAVYYKIRDWKKDYLPAYYDEKTFPKFAALPEKDRVLEAPYIAQCGIPPGTLNPTYEEGRFFLATYKIILDHWPELSAALGCGFSGDGPEFKLAYYGFLRYNCLLSMKGYIDPSYRRTIGVIVKIPAAQRADLLERTRELFCNDIKAKQARWKDPRIPADLLELDFFQNLHCECMGVQGLPPCAKQQGDVSTIPAKPSAPAPNHDASAMRPGAPPSKPVPPESPRGRPSPSTTRR
ncbi:MAG: hypothetical protein WBS54_05810 [Acidobacteriota bacterium]